ncbi:KELCH REPEAT DOMAIN [Salix koriyanagi]|uniref:KELCH REPEAT DOMAIN n=1 Tax=Salix koriyanagi TaxID=2511006 RepID=A0A9Q0VYP0_9ROSI|nr:KELCH REPEAT DOMAIN [Salix koriyanagi]
MKLSGRALKNQKNQNNLFSSVQILCIPKKKRHADLKAAWEIDSEQEEHSLSLSQHSSPSQSDQEQFPAHKSVDSLASCQGFNFLRQLNKNPRNCRADDVASNQKKPRTIIERTPYSLQISRENKRAEQYVHGGLGRQGTPFPPIVHRPVEAGSTQNLVGAEVRGKVDGAFDSGLLMTATVDGKIFRGSLVCTCTTLCGTGKAHSSSKSRVSRNSVSHCPSISKLKSYRFLTALSPSNNILQSQNVVRVFDKLE